jgi:hypothetical protein
MKAVADAHAAVNGQRVFARTSKHFHSQPTVVQCTYDETARTVRMEIAGEPEAGVALFPSMPAAEFLYPIVMHNTYSMREAAVFTIDSEPE